tara:strand:+ start:835 stop:1278 length:444 start_codon:yes stop_codon:yes gene_type:complete
MCKKETFEYKANNEQLELTDDIKGSKHVLMYVMNELNKNKIDSEKKISKIHDIKKLKRDNIITWKFIVSFYDKEHVYEIIVQENGDKMELLKFNINNNYIKIEKYESKNQNDTFEYMYDLNVATYSKHSLCDYKFPELPNPLSDRSV